MTGERPQGLGREEPLSAVRKGDETFSVLLLCCMAGTAFSDSPGTYRDSKIEGTVRLY